jgi:hypothetical protein
VPGHWLISKLISTPPNFLIFLATFSLVAVILYAAAMTSTPKRQKNRDGSYTPTSPDSSATDGILKRKPVGGGASAAGNDADDPLLAAWNNPYLAHRVPDGYVPQFGAAQGPLRDFRKRNTTAKQARKAEEGPTNPFTLQPLSTTYFDILKKRRELPVHAQRYV